MIDLTPPLGLRSAYVAGFHHALMREYDFAMQMDCDLSHDTRALRHLLSVAREAGVVVESRYVT